jgi:di/tricarboxylate transporter
LAVAAQVQLTTRTLITTEVHHLLAAIALLLEETGMEVTGRLLAAVAVLLVAVSTLLVVTDRAALLIPLAATKLLVLVALLFGAAAVAVLPGLVRTITLTVKLGALVAAVAQTQPRVKMANKVSL